MIVFGVLKEDFDEKGVPIFFKEYMKRNKLNYQDVVLLDDCVDRSGNYARLGFQIREIKDSAMLISIIKEYINL